jgi:hypothetical protein
VAGGAVDVGSIVDDVLWYFWALSGFAILFGGFAIDTPRSWWRGCCLGWLPQMDSGGHQAANWKMDFSILHARSSDWNVIEVLLLKFC